MRLIYILYILSFISCTNEPKYIVKKYCAKPGSHIKGTYYIGGAGLNGPYTQNLIIAFHKAGIKSVIRLDRKKWSMGQYRDALISVFSGREYNSHFPMLLWLYPGSHKQFNLVGYSYGSLIAAQLAVKYAQQGSTINHLVLIASPISEHFLNIVKSTKRIKKVFVINLDKYGDPVYAGMKTSELVFSVFKLIDQEKKQEGHFYYTKEGIEGDKRRVVLANDIYKLGLR